MKKLVCTTLAACIFTTIGVPAFALGVDALPNLPTDVTNTNVVKDGANMNITVGGGQAGAVDTIIWKDYNIGKDATVNYEFTNHNQTSINKVDVGGGLSQIYGKITNSSSCVGGAACGYEATSKVFLLNPNGILFGNTANVNLNSFTVSTFDLKQDETDPNKFIFEKTNDSTSNYNLLEVIDTKNMSEEEINNNLKTDPDNKIYSVMRGEKIYVYQDLKPIAIMNEAKIHGDKAVGIVGDTIFTYKGSLISTSTTPNYNPNDAGVFQDTYGDVKLVTADGVTFQYYANGGIDQIPKKTDANGKLTPEFKYSSDQMMISLNGDIDAGQIDIQNRSTNDASLLNISGSTLKATKAVKGAEGSIYLTSNNNIIMGNAELETLNADGAETRVKDADAEELLGTIRILSQNKVSIGSSNLSAVDDVTIKSANNDVVVDASIINAIKDAQIEAINVASVQNNSNIKANNISLIGNKIQVYGSELEATNDVNINAYERVWLSDSFDEVGNKVKDTTIKAGNNLNIVAAYGADGGPYKGSIQLTDVTLNASKINMGAEENITGSADLTNSKTQMAAINDINLNLKGVGDRQNGLVATAGNDMTLTTDGTLSVSSLISGNNMTLTANEIIAGEDLTTNHLRVDGDSADRSYIQVGGKFNSTPRYKVTDSADLTPDGLYNQRHHIYYGSAETPEKILLVNKLPAPAQPIEPTPLPNVNDDQASMLNKLPQQPQSIKPSNNITDGRTMFLDVFAAASQIEIDDEEE